MSTSSSLVQRLLVNPPNLETNKGLLFLTFGTEDSWIYRQPGEKCTWSKSLRTFYSYLMRYLEKYGAQHLQYIALGPTPYFFAIWNRGTSSHSKFVPVFKFGNPIPQTLQQLIRDKSLRFCAMGLGIDGSYVISYRDAHEPNQLEKCQYNLQGHYKDLQKQLEFNGRGIKSISLNPDSSTDFLMIQKSEGNYDLKYNIEYHPGHSEVVKSWMAANNVH